jgi:DNA-binding transcriptional ArsR family regulator
VKPKGSIYVCGTKRLHVMMKRDVFQGIADPTRREILNLLAHKKLNVNAVAGNFNVTRTAVYKHMKILVECGLVTMTQQGRERLCEGRLDRLGEVTDWVEEHRKIWNDRFDNLEIYLKQLQASEKKMIRKKKHK